VNDADKRLHPRAFFDEDAGITAYFERNRGDEKPFPSFVINMSVGGLGISTRERLSGKFAQGDIIHLNFIKNGSATTSIRGISCEVKWILEEPTNDKLVLGLEFRVLDGVMEGVIQQFIEAAR